jgi:molybdopterin-containing oxidoreductase family iron-sulfur binding subunit
MNKTYWKGLDEKFQTPEFVEKAKKEFAEELPVEEFIGDAGSNEFKTGRRDFLKFLGFGVAAATLASCESPVIKSIPYVNKPEDITPGVANWYATTFYDGNDFANILVKAREGRPIWIKGNKHYGITKGGLTPRINASVLSLYNGERLQNPTFEGAETSWSDVDAQITKELKTIAGSGGKIRILSNSIISPSTLELLNAFKESVGGDVELVQYDAISYSAMRKANEKNFGKAFIPDYDFSKAKAIVSIDADFMANWLLPTKFNADYSVTRKPENGWMSRHFHFESTMSLTGANADYRTMIKPSQQGAVAAAILKHLGGKDVTTELDAKIDEACAAAAAYLKQHKGASIVVAGANDVATQLVVNAINNLLGNYGKTIDNQSHLTLKKGDDAKVEALVNDVISGKVKALFCYGVNPVYTLPNGQAFGEALKSVQLSVSFSQFADETATKCKYVCPDHNYLESWNDYNPKVGYYAMQQPLIRPLFNSRQAQESFLVWSGNAERGDKESKVYYNYIRNNWEKYGFPMQDEYASFEEYWNWAVHNGSSAASAAPIVDILPADSEGVESSTSSVGGFTDATSEAGAGIKAMATNTGAFELIAYQTGELGDGQYAANPWLQELPNAITKVTWDNYITMAVQDACALLGIDFDPNNQIKSYNALHLAQEELAYVATVSVGEQSLKLPIYPLPGQARGTVGVALGYGRGEGDEKIGKAAYQVELDQSGNYIMKDGKRVPIGGNAFRLTSFVGGQIQYHGVATLNKTEERYNLACTQTHHTIMGRRSVLKETDISTFLAGNKNAYNHPHELHVHTKGGEAHVPVTSVTLWDEHPVELVGHRWGMSIDLTSCNGCGVCIVACHSENNVPVVGKDEIRRGRDMHWLRMDRYFSSIEDDNRKAYEKDFKTGSYNYDNMEVPEESPSVVFMPMLCQHCNHAPCETVCPVAATTHSNEGLNMMAYNRCIGTRYCGNNCPYKVRRFNWFNYRDYKKFDKVNSAQDEYARLVLNPDVTVRSRGVMEKCSFCVQRIQEGKLNAKAEGRPVVDGDVVSACADACPNNCITFGDWNDDNSKVRELSGSPRAYQALEEVGVKPNIWYHVKVRNVDADTVASETAADNHAH